MICCFFLAEVRVTIAGRDLRPTAVFDTYWRFAAARQQVYEARLAERRRRGRLTRSWPRTGLPTATGHADRVSQFLITQVCYRGDQSWDEVFFRTLLFKIFNRVSTWRLLTQELGAVTWAATTSPPMTAVLE